MIRCLRCLLLERFLIFAFSNFSFLPPPSRSFLLILYNSINFTVKHASFIIVAFSLDLLLARRVFSFFFLHRKRETQSKARGPLYSETRSFGSTPSVLETEKVWKNKKERNRLVQNWWGIRKCAKCVLLRGCVVIQYVYHFVEILYDDSIVNNKTNCLPSRC